MELADRPYQSRAIAACLEHLQAGRRVVLVAPTGSGKSHCSRRIVSSFSRPYAITHRRELRDQIGIPGATVQSILRRRPKRLDDADIVVWDECHHAPADRWSSVLDGVRCPVLGLTATPDRGDGTGLGGVFERMVVAAQYPDLVRDGYLCRVRLLRPSQAVDAPSEDPVRAYLRHTPGARAVVYCADVAHAESVAAGFRSIGACAAAVHGELSQQARRDALRANILVGVHVLTEGLDIPELSTCILARGFSSVSSYLQAVGRVLRPHPSKAVPPGMWDGRGHVATVIDLMGASWTHGSPISARTYSLTKGIGPGPRGPRDCPQCGWCGDAKVCPVCRWDFWSNTKRKRRRAMIRRDLYESFLDGTADSLTVWGELRSAHGLYRAGLEYKRMYGANPPYTGDEASRLRADQIRIGKMRGYRPGWAFARLRSVGL